MATAKKHVAKDGKVTYHIRAYAGYDAYGKQIEKRMTWTPEPGMTEKAIKKELERQKVIFEDKIKFIKHFDPNTTFKTYSETWLENNKPPQLAPKTYNRYKELLENINMGIGHIKLIELQSHHLQSFYNNLRESGSSLKGSYAVETNLVKTAKKRKLTKVKLSEMSGVSLTTVRSAFKGNHVSILTAQAIAKALDLPENKLFEIHLGDMSYADKTILHHHRLIGVILRQATRDHIVPYNVSARDYIKAPRVPRKEAAFLDDKELEVVLKCLQNENIKWRMAVEFLLCTGMRRGELMGLEWKDIDFENKLLHIYRTSQYLPTLGIITKDTKTSSSQRTITLPDNIFPLLNEYKEYWKDLKYKMGDLWQDEITITYIDGKKEVVENDRLFIKDDSTPMNPDSLTSWTADFVKKYNLPKFTPHSLRHTNASLLIANGINIPTVSKRLGHASVSTTTNIYSHAVKTSDEKAANLIAEKLNPLNNSKK